MSESAGVLPSRLQELVTELLSVDADTRGDILIELSDQYSEVPESVATRPYPELAKVPGCESEVYAFVVNREDGTKDFHFAVENPQGISAMAMAAIVQETLNGEELEKIAQIPEDVVYQIFGRTLSMGKGQGLMSMMGVVKALARRQ